MKKVIYKTLRNNRGIAALLIVVILSASSLLMAFTAALIGLGELDMGYTLGQGSSAFSVADGCTEETLRRIRLDNNYGIGAGTMNLSILGDTCEINVTGAGAGRTINVLSATGNNFSKNIETDITISALNVITVTSWKEL